jgi:GT2 family glycosyltransferase
VRRRVTAAAGHPTVDVVIVAYNRYDLTHSCLAHLQAQAVPHHVIVVDNGSQDGTRERLQAEWPDVQLETNDVNRPFPVACNQGVAAGTGEIVVLLNNDVDVRPEFLERLLAPLRDAPRLGSVAALCVQPGDALIDSIGMAADPTLGAFPRHQGLPVARAGDALPVLVGPAGTAAAYRRGAWEEVGGLDEHVFAYGEDFDLALRLRAAGWDTTAAVDAVGTHLGSATFVHRSAFQRRNGGFSRGYFLRRYGILRSPAGPRTLLTEAIVCAGDLVISRDLEALKGRLEGWRSAKGMPRRRMPPRAAIDHGIGFRESLARRRGVYARSAA